jgi:hypothetical protein
VSFGTAFIVIIGFTTIVNVCVFPGHPLINGVTVIVAVTGVTPGFVAVKAGKLPEPLAAKPMLVLLFVQV